MVDISLFSVPRHEFTVSDTRTSSLTDLNNWKSHLLSLWADSHPPVLYLCGILPQNGFAV